MKNQIPTRIRLSIYKSLFATLTLATGGGCNDVRPADSSNGASSPAPAAISTPTPTPTPTPTVTPDPPPTPTASISVSGPATVYAGICARYRIRWLDETGALGLVPANASVQVATVATSGANGEFRTLVGSPCTTSTTIETIGAGNGTVDVGWYSTASAGSTFNLKFTLNGHLVTKAITVQTPGATAAVDTGFATAGKFLQDFGTGQDRVRNLALQDDGKIVAAGFKTVGNKISTLIRLLPDGTLDPSFGTGGVAVTDFSPGAASIARGVVIQPDQKIVFTGYLTTSGIAHPFIARYLTNGTLDASFGTGGIGYTAAAIVNPVQNIFAYALGRQRDGKLIAVTQGTAVGASTSSAIVSRYTATGALDTTYGTGGSTLIDVPGGSTVGMNVVIDPATDYAIIGGYAANAAKIFAARLDTNGNLDAGFGTGGLYVNTVGILNSTVAYGLNLDANGRILLTGQYNNGSIVTGLTVRLTPNGALDTAFGSSGLSTSYGSAIGEAIVEQSDGKLAIAGWSGADFAVARLDANGSIDTAFGTSGVATAPMGGSSDTVFAALALSDGRILLGGEAVIAGNAQIALTVVWP